MKNALKVLAIVLSVCIIATVLASCSQMLSGTYSTEGDLVLLKSKDSYTFKGNNFTHTTTTTGGITGSQTTTEVKGTYKITKADDGTKTISFTVSNDDGTTTTNSYAFVEGTNDAGNATVKIGTVVYTKAK